MTCHSKKIEEEIDPFDMVHTSDPSDADPMWYSMAEDSGEILLLDDEVKTIEVKKEKKLIVSTSLIKDLMYNGNEIDYCPNYIYHKYLTDTEVMKPSDAMIKGSFGETILLGSSARGKSTPDLERKRNGEKTIDQERIDILKLIEKNNERIWQKLDSISEKLDEKFNVLTVLKTEHDQFKNNCLKK